MNTLHLVSKAAVLAAAVGLIGMVAFYGSSIASAQRPGDVRWEHCFVSYGSIVKDADGRDERYETAATITYLFGGSVRTEQVKASGADDQVAITRDAVSQAISRLGNTGWEMVSVGPSIFPNGETVLYFKRQQK